MRISDWSSDVCSSDLFPRNEWESDENGRQNDPWDCEDDLQIMLRKPGAEPSLRPEEQHENQARHGRRYGESQIDEGYEQTLARKIDFGDRPGCGKDTKHVDRYDAHTHQKAEPDGRQPLGFNNLRSECLYSCPMRP